MVQQIFGGVEILLGAAGRPGPAGGRRVIPGDAGRPALITAIGVWKSIIDPWGWFLEGSSVLFYPSAIIAAGALLLWGTMDEDEMALDAVMTS